MSTQTMPEPQATPAQARRGILDDIVENTDARKQAEQARADQITAKVYGDDPRAYVIALGRDYGLGSAHAQQMIWVDQKTGKPNLYAGARATFLQQAGYNWVPVEMSAKRVCLRFTRNGKQMLDANEKPLEVSYTFEDAERAEYVARARGDKKTGNYDKFPVNMLFARCISNFHRWFAPHVMGATIYDVGEVRMEDIVAATEERIQAKSAETLDAIEAELVAAAAGRVA